MGFGLLTGKSGVLFRSLIKNDWANKIPDAVKEQFVQTLENVREHYKEDKDGFTPKLMQTLNCFKLLEPEKLRLVILADAAPSHSGEAIRSFEGKQSEAEVVLDKLLTVSFGYNAQLDYNKWHEQGVMLLPTTFSSHRLPPKNHKKMWEDVIAEFMNMIDVQQPCWLIFGEDNHKYARHIGIRAADIQTKSLTIENLDELIADDVFHGTNKILSFLNKPHIEWV